MSTCAAVTRRLRCHRWIARRPGLWSARRSGRPGSHRISRYSGLQSSQLVIGLSRTVELLDLSLQQGVTHGASAQLLVQLRLRKLTFESLLYLTKIIEGLAQTHKAIQVPTRRGTQPHLHLTQHGLETRHVVAIASGIGFELMRLLLQLELPLQCLPGQIVAAQADRGHGPLLPLGSLPIQAGSVGIRPDCG